MEASRSDDHLAELRQRAAGRFSTRPRPFLRWAGSKQAALSHLVDVLPRQFGVYREPFLGSAALFFLLQPTRAVLTDKCGDLIATFGAVRDAPGAVIAYLNRLKKPRPKVFYRIRKKRSRGRIKRAAEFLYLNKSCWNGLYRVNSQGHFNVPYGRPKTDNIIDADNLRACSRSLARPEVRLATGDFDDALNGSAAGDLVYLDPPYVTGHSNNGFIDYNEVLFSWKDQERLANTARRLAADGVYVVVTNAYHQAVIDLYEGFAVRLFERASTLASAVSKRGRVIEAVLWSAPR